jgi:hypothetical protein
MQTPEYNNRPNTVAGRKTKLRTYVEEKATTSIFTEHVCEGAVVLLIE